MNSAQETTFDFGENWSAFSEHALDEAKVAQARRDFASLISDLPLPGRAFLDIGFGQGLGLLCAAEQGAVAVGCDLNPKCAAVLDRNRRFFPALAAQPPAMIGSILDDRVVAELCAASPRSRGYDIVHSWGVLHHTGDMVTAIRHATELVAPDGYLIVALYKRHWTSPIWKGIKRLYVASPRWLQRTMVTLLYPVIYVAKWAATGRNPKLQERGMSFYYDVVDWVGGYPYEYASADEVNRLLLPLGFKLTRFRGARVPTGCNEYVFQREPHPGA